MHTCILSHGTDSKRSGHSCPRWVNAGNKNTPSKHHPRRRNVTTAMVGLKKGHIRKNLTKNGEPQRYSWERRRRRRRMVNPRDIAGEGSRRRRMVNPRDIAGEGRRRRIRMVNPRYIAGEGRRRRRRMVNPRYIAGEGRRRIRMVNPRYIAGEGRRRIRMVNPRYIAGEGRRRRMHSRKPRRVEPVRAVCECKWY